MARVATLVLTSLTVVVLTFGSISTVQLFFTEGEGPGFGYVLIWPSTCLLYGVLTAVALWAASRLADGLLWLGSLLAVDVLVWFAGLPTLASIVGKLPFPNLNPGALLAILAIFAFDGCALYIAGRFLFRGGRSTILGQ